MEARKANLVPTSSQKDTSALEMRLKRALKESGSSNGLAHGVLNMVISESYEYAAKETGMYIASKSEYPMIEKYAEKYVEIAKQLISQIESQRGLPGLESLSMAKRQVINDGIVSCFNNLKEVLLKIENIEYNQRMSDLRSTLIVVKTFSWCVLGIVLLAFAQEMFTGLFQSALSTGDDLITKSVDWVFNIF